jgi:hypothetical protein
MMGDVLIIRAATRADLPLSDDTLGTRRADKTSA